MDTTALRIEGQKLNDEIKARRKRLDEINAALLKDGPGKFPECTIVGESTSVCFPADDDLDRVKELAGDHYANLFERVVSWKPVKGFKDVVNALCNSRTAEAILKRCTAAKAGYVKWN